MDEVTFNDLLNVLDGAIQDHNPKAFVCTPETFKVVQRMKRPELMYNWNDPMIVLGVPIRIEEEPKLGPGEVLLELDNG